MVYQVPARKKSVKQNVFEFKVPDDDTLYSLPAMRQIKPARIAQIESGSLSALRDLFEEHAPGSFDKLNDSEELDGVMDAWAEESKLSVGESSASADS